jgi:hypothetical protein
VTRYLSVLAAGSYLALSHITADMLPPRSVQRGIEVYGGATQSAHPRTRAQIERFFDGLELVPPFEGAGPVIANVGVWGSEDQAAADSDGSRAFFCGVARLP